MDDRYEKDIVDIARDYSKWGLLFRRRDCQFCLCPMLLVRNAESSSQLIWQCARCGLNKGVTMNTPLCYMDIKQFDIAINLWIDNVWPRLAQSLVRDRGQVTRNFQLIRKACSLFIKTKVLPYLHLPGVVEIDETRLGRQKLSRSSIFARKINRVFGMFCRTTGIPVFYYIPDRKHPTLARIIRKHVPIQGMIVTDTMTSYVRPRTEHSRLDQYGLYHYYINITQHNIHEKFSFVYINNVRRNFLELKKHISAYHRMYVPVEKVDQFIHAFMFRALTQKKHLYQSTLKLIRDYYNFQLDIYLTRYDDRVEHVPNVLTIDQIDKLLDGHHPDDVASRRNRFKLGTYLAKVKHDPISDAFLKNKKAANEDPNLPASMRSNNPDLDRGPSQSFCEDPYSYGAIQRGVAENAGQNPISSEFPGQPQAEPSSTMSQSQRVLGAKRIHSQSTSSVAPPTLTVEQQKDNDIVLGALYENMQAMDEKLKQKSNRFIRSMAEVEFELGVGTDEQGNSLPPQKPAKLPQPTPEPKEKPSFELGLVEEIVDDQQSEPWSQGQALAALAPDPANHRPSTPKPQSNNYGLPISSSIGGRGKKREEKGRQKKTNWEWDRNPVYKGNKGNSSKKDKKKKDKKHKDHKEHKEPKKKRQKVEPQFVDLDD